MFVSLIKLLLKPPTCSPEGEEKEKSEKCHPDGFSPPLGEDGRGLCN